MKKWLLIRLLCLLMLSGRLPNPLYAQPPNVTFDHLSVKDGLPGSDVYSIAKDQQGFMWFGTRRCPVRYDGDTFRSFLFPETYLITGMAADSANRMWVATERQGIASIDPSTGPLAGTRGNTSYLFIDAAGQGWFGDTKGVNRIDYRTKKFGITRFGRHHFGVPKSTVFWKTTSTTSG